MDHSLNRTLLSLPTCALLLGITACASQHNSSETANDVESLPPNSADTHQQEMKESEQAAQDMQMDAAEEATDNVDNVSVEETPHENLTTDEVDTDPND